MLKLRTFPWWAPDAVKFVNDYLTKDSLVLEFGGGGSSPWLADRAKKVITIEHHPKWARMIRESNKENLEVRELSRPYNLICKEFKDNTFDLIIVDGRDRVKCFKDAKRLVKPGGWIALDDAARERYGEAWKSVSSWKEVKYKNKDPKEMRTGSRMTWFWQKPNE